MDYTAHQRAWNHSKHTLFIIVIIILGFSPHSIFGLVYRNEVIQDEDITITSKEYPNPYPPNLNFTWVCQSNTSKWAVVFEEFDLDKPSGTVQIGDWLELYDGKKLLRYTSLAPPLNNYESHGHDLKISFISDGNSIGKSRGFKIRLFHGKDGPELVRKIHSYLKSSKETKKQEKEDNFLLIIVIVVCITCLLVFGLVIAGIYRRRMRSLGSSERDAFGIRRNSGVFHSRNSRDESQRHPPEANVIQAHFVVSTPSPTTNNTPRRESESSNNSNAIATSNHNNRVPAMPIARSISQQSQGLGQRDWRSRAESNATVRSYDSSASGSVSVASLKSRPTNHYTSSPVRPNKATSFDDSNITGSIIHNDLNKPCRKDSSNSSYSNHSSISEHSSYSNISHAPSYYSNNGIEDIHPHQGVSSPTELKPSNAIRPNQLALLAQSPSTGNETINNAYTNIPSFSSQNSGSVSHDFTLNQGNNEHGALYYNNTSPTSCSLTSPSSEGCINRYEVNINFNNNVSFDSIPRSASEPYSCNENFNNLQGNVKHINGKLELRTNGAIGNRIAANTTQCTNDRADSPVWSPTRNSPRRKISKSVTFEEGIPETYNYIKESVDSLNSDGAGVRVDDDETLHPHSSSLPSVPSELLSSSSIPSYTDPSQVNAYIVEEKDVEDNSQFNNDCNNTSKITTKEFDTQPNALVVDPEADTSNQIHLKRTTGKENNDDDIIETSPIEDPLSKVLKPKLNKHHQRLDSTSSTNSDSGYIFHVPHQQRKESLRQQQIQKQLEQQQEQLQRQQQQRQAHHMRKLSRGSQSSPEIQSELGKALSLDTKVRRVGTTQSPWHSEKSYDSGTYLIPKSSDSSESVPVRNYDNSPKGGTYLDKQITSTGHNLSQKLAPNLNKKIRTYSNSSTNSSDYIFMPGVHDIHGRSRQNSLQGADFSGGSISSGYYDRQNSSSPSRQHRRGSRPLQRQERLESNSGDSYNNKTGNDNNNDNNSSRREENAYMIPPSTFDRKKSQDDGLYHQVPRYDSTRHEAYSSIECQLDTNIPTSKLLSTSSSNTFSQLYHYPRQTQPLSGTECVEEG